MGKRVSLLIGILFFLGIKSATSQTVYGRVTDEFNSPLPFVTVTVKGETLGTTTDLEGGYILDLGGVSSIIVFSFIGYNEIEKITNGGELNVVLGSKTEMLEVAEVVTRVNKNNEVILLLDKKEEISIESSIGSVELKKKGISNAQEGLKKVSGVTFNSNRINVRGLGDRYNQITLNGIPLPSNNTDRKNLNLKLLPTVFLENIKVKKTYSTEQWSNLAGAQINIASSGVRNVKNISLGYTFNTQTNEPITGLSFILGKNTSKIKYLVALSNNITNSFTYGNTRIINKQGNYILDYNFNNNQTTVNRNGVGVLALDKRNFNLKNTLLFTTQNILSNRTTSGNHFDYETEIFTTRKTPTTHNLILNQIELNYYNDLFDLKTIGNISYVSSGESQREQFVYLYNGNYSLNNIDRLDNHLFSNQNRETRYSLITDLRKQVGLYKLYGGYAFNLTNNTFDYSHEYFDLTQVNVEYDNINPNNPYDYINESNSISYFVTDPSSFIKGQNIVNGGFLKGEYYGANLNLGSGIRIEHVYQNVQYQDQLIPSLTRNHFLRDTEFLPYLSLKYKLNEIHQFRITNSITTVRPRFRELTPFIYTEVFAGSKIQGNPNLINSKIYNTDISYELYPNQGEMVAFNIFNKIINNPIEKINVSTASGRLETYQNSESAIVVGGEIDIKKKFNNFHTDYNLSILWSEIKITDEGPSSVIVTNLNRPLQGSSPILSNLDVFYNLNQNNNLGITYSYTGKKLNSVGVLGLGDIYQRAQHFLNIIYNYNKNNFSSTILLNNILNTEFVLDQDSDAGNIIINNFRTGVNLSLKIKYNF